MYSGWEERWNDIAAFRNVDNQVSHHFPGFGVDAAEFLVSERAIHGIVSDTLGLDSGKLTSFPVHHVILGAGLIGIKNVANLAQIVGK